jgi:hypothetical protein
LLNLLDLLVQGQQPVALLFQLLREVVDLALEPLSLCFVDASDVLGSGA